MARTEQEIIANGNLVTDIDDSYISKEIVSYARNSMLSTHNGNSYFRTNEPSTTACVTTDLPILSLTPLKGNRTLIISTNNVTTEFGIEENCVYKKLFLSDCLGFNLNFPVTARFKENKYGEEIVTITDGNKPIRRINIQQLPYTYTLADDSCTTKEFTSTINCDDTLLFKKLTVPNIEVSRGFGGNLDNGMWSVVVAYATDGAKYSDYYSESIPVPLYTQGGGNSLDIKLSNLDRDFDQFELVVIGTVKGVTTAKHIGFFDTNTNYLQVTDFDKPEFTTIPLETLVITKIIYDKAGIISGNSEYLILADITKKKPLNFQNQLDDVKAEYVVKQVPLNYYKDGGNEVGHYRGEVYAYFLRYLYDSGDYTPDATVYGRKAKGKEKSLASGKDVYEAVDPNYTKKVEYWEVNNTAGKFAKLNTDFVANERILGYGEMGYWESVEKYEDNVELYGDNACTPIRHHKFPDESTVPRYQVINGETYINILGIRFKNIPHPVDETGKPVSNIVGYEILRASREGGNRTIVARGMLTNARGYKETQGQQLDVIYANYPFNDRRADSFLSSKQTTHTANKESNFKGLTTVYNDKFNFYTPHAYFNNKYKMGREFVIESEEVADVEGYFQETYQHPKDYLLTNFTMYFALVMGAIQGYLTTTPKYKKTTTGVESALGVASGTARTQSAETSDDIANSVLFTTPFLLGLNANQIVKKVLQTLAKAGMFIFFSAEYAANVIKIIKNFSPLRNFAYQYNSHATFNRSVQVTPGSKRRYTLRQPEYLSPNLHTVGKYTVNNFNRPESVFVELSSELPFPSIEDNTRRTINEFRTSPDTKVKSIASAYYATSKIKNPAQYGQIGAQMKVKTATNTNLITLKINSLNKAEPYESPVLFGGDCSIGLMSIMNTMPFFTQDLSGSNLPNGTIQYDYRMYRNIGYPRFWADFSDYELGNLITKSPSLGKTPTNKFNLDGIGNSGVSNAFTVADRYFYTSYNGVMSFIVESDYHIAFREPTPEKPFYSESSSNLSDVLRADRIRKPEEFKLDKSFSKLEAKEFYSQTIARDFNSLRLQARDQNAVAYSLPSFSGQNIDNWQYFLPGNYFSFSNTDFGNITGVHKLDQDRIVFLFDKASPYVSLGRDQLETLGGRKVTIGDAGLFAQQPREIIHTDTNYGSTQSRFAFSSTPFGAFYPSARAGRIFGLAGNLDDVTRQGMHFWAKTYMPLQLPKSFPDYPYTDSPTNGVGYMMVVDSVYELVYVIKKDYIPIDKSVTYNKEKDRFEAFGFEVSLKDPTYFKNISFALSFNPTKGFNSWHDWAKECNGVLQTENHFITVSGNGMWKHNEATDSFCNFYGKDYPFSVGVPSNTGKDTHILASAEFELQGYKYRNERDKFHVLNETFDRFQVYNSEQISEMYAVIPKPENPYTADEYPKQVNGQTTITCSIKEQHHRINQFWDSTRDRGQFTNNEYPLFLNNEDGYTSIINPIALDKNKPAEERKKFRHNVNHMRFTKQVSGAVQYIFKFITAKIKSSPR